MSSVSALRPIDGVVGFPECRDQAAELAKLLRLPYETAVIHAFPDGESLVQVQSSVPRVAVYRSLHHPATNMFETILAASALRDLGATRITLIAPYLPYMRQDIAFAPGQAVSQRVLGNIFAPVFDEIVTIDPHLHRTRDLSAVFNGKPSAVLSAAAAIAAHARAEAQTPYGLVLGPDEESGPFVALIGKQLGVAWQVAIKVRHGDRHVAITIPEDTVIAGQRVLIADDVISTGATIATLASALKSRGAHAIDVYATHALCAENAVMALQSAGVDRIVSTDSIPHATNGISAARIIAAAFLHAGGRI